MQYSICYKIQVVMEEKEEAKIGSLDSRLSKVKSPVLLLSMILAVYSYLAFCAQRNAIFFLLVRMFFMFIRISCILHFHAHCVI